MRRISLRQLFVVMVAMTVSLAAVCVRAQDKVTLKLNLPANEAWDTNMSMDMSMKMKVTANGQDQDIDQKMKLTITGQNTPLEVKDGSPTKMKVSFGNDCKISMSMMGRDQNVPFPLAGKTLTVSRDADGNVTVAPEGVLGDQNKDMLKNMMDSSKAFYPDRPVGVGDTWEIKGEVVAKLFQMGPDAKGTITCALKKFGEQNGRKTAEVSIKGAIAGNMQNMAVSVDMDGPLVVDLATGQALSSEMTANMSLKAAGETPVSGTGVIRVKQTNTLVK